MKTLTKSFWWLVWNFLMLVKRRHMVTATHEICHVIVAWYLSGLLRPQGLKMKVMTVEIRQHPEENEGETTFNLNVPPNQKKQLLWTHCILCSAGFTSSLWHKETYEKSGVASDWPMLVESAIEIMSYHGFSNPPAWITSLPSSEVENSFPDFCDEVEVPEAHKKVLVTAYRATETILRAKQDKLYMCASLLFLAKRLTHDNLYYLLGPPEDFTKLFN